MEIGKHTLIFYLWFAFFREREVRYALASSEIESAIEGLFFDDFFLKINLNNKIINNYIFRKKKTKKLNNEKKLLVRLLGGLA